MIHGEFKVQGREKITALSDSIRNILLSLAGSQNRNFLDVINQGIHHPFRNDHVVDFLKRVCASFLDELDLIGLKEREMNAVITEYR